MARLLLLGVAVLFVVALAGLTLSVLTREGITLGALVLIAPSVFVVIVLAVGIVGALRQPPK